MYLRDVMVLPAGYDRNDISRLRASCDHVLDILREFLPHKYDLGGLRRLVLELGQVQAIVRQYYDTGGVGYYSHPDFDLESFFGLPPSQQEERILECVEQGLIDVARRLSADPVPLALAVAQVRDSRYTLETNLKCSRVHPTRRFRVAVIRQFARGGVFVRAEVRCKSGVLKHCHELASGAWVVAVSDKFHSSRWNGNTLEILDHAGRLTSAIDCGQLVTS
ncbi:MAG: hypothetical protein R3337_10035 [Gammaproteobacteria bacterium]|nr:hypothetical protein [Gammaproteobacteria bacterium]